MTNQVIFAGSDAGPRTRRDLKRWPDTQHWEGQVDGFFLPKNKVCFYQFCYEIHAGQEFYSQPARLNTTVVSDKIFASGTPETDDGGKVAADNSKPPEAAPTDDASQLAVPPVPPVKPPTRTLTPGNANSRPPRVRPAPPKDPDFPRDESLLNSPGTQAMVWQPLAERHKPIMDIAVSPDGKTIYAAYFNDSSITAYDSETFHELGRIQLQFQPTQLWCGKKSLLATCSSARTIFVIDTATRMPKTTLQVTTELGMQPVQIIGCTSDSKYLTLWYSVNSPKHEHALYIGDETGSLSLVYSANMEHCVYSPERQRLIGQNNMGGSGLTGQLELYSLKQRVG